MQYFIHLGGHSAPKNNLQKTVLAHLHLYDGKVINDHQKITAQIRDAIDDINLQYPKCRPLVLHNWKATVDTIGISFGEQWTCNIYLFKIKGEIK